MSPQPDIPGAGLEYAVSRDDEMPGLDASTMWCEK